METEVNAVLQKTNYEFIDALRCIAMMLIVFQHCLTQDQPNFQFGSQKYVAVLLVIQFGKFSTIMFFLLAGFLLGEKFNQYTPGQYYKRRIANTLWPWIFWSFLYMIIDIIKLGNKDFYLDNSEFLDNILDDARGLYFYSNYWFIMNFMISIGILLLFKRYIHSFYFGGFLLFCTIFYSINIHYEWITPNHTKAVFGFVFFIWLGAQVRRYWEKIDYFLKKTSFTLLFFIVLITYILSVFETNQLYHRSIDATNTLRVSNILYSLVCFFLLLKIKYFNFIKFFKPRETTFGIYLIHYIFVVFLLSEIFKPFYIDVFKISLLSFLAIKLTQFFIVYFLAFFLVLIIKRSPFKRLVGN